jgi:hypothetical protein
MSICRRCLTGLNRQGWRRQAISAWQASPAEHLRRPQTRQIAWLTSLFATPEQKPSDQKRSTEPQPLSSVRNTTGSEPTPDNHYQVPPSDTAQELLKTALEEHQARKLIARAETPPEPTKPTISKAIQKQLEEWQQTQPIELALPAGFQDPLGHLTDDEQIAYLNDPPLDYLETLERRASAREEYEKLLYLSNPVQHWRLSCSVEPGFSLDSIKPWIPWSPEKRLAVMEKFRRYDERCQTRYRNIYGYFDSAVARQGVKKRLLAKLQSDVMSQPSKSKREKKRGRTKLLPPKEVFEVMIRREVIRLRNTALLEAQKTVAEELAKFEDITEKGVRLSAQASQLRGKKQMEKEDRIKKEEYKQWSKMSQESKVESVDWGAIHNEG